MSEQLLGLSLSQLATACSEATGSCPVKRAQQPIPCAPKTDAKCKTPSRVPVKTTLRSCEGRSFKSVWTLLDRPTSFELPFSGKWPLVQLIVILVAARICARTSPGIAVKILWAFLLHPGGRSKERKRACHMLPSSRPLLLSNISEACLTFSFAVSFCFASFSLSSFRNGSTWKTSLRTTKGLRQLGHAKPWFCESRCFV
mmetsp:Transcript_22652/g.45874  ORF Transcript_22652/g.45874 Transcript_22652/m.45874 type:complete len:200 (-) Transcript_22652:1938-2537(-)